MSNSTTYDRIAFKASHNSYDDKGTLDTQLTFNPSNPSENGCMGVELDIWRHSSPYVPYQSISADYFTVNHLTPGSTTLASYLDQLLSWHRSNPGHDPVLVTLDIKSSDGGFSNFQDELDTYLYCYFGQDLIFQPNRLLRNTQLTLCENVRTTGWPTLDEMQGLFLFCLSGNNSWKTQYANTNLPQRYCFSDQDESDSNKNLQPPASGNFVFFNFHVYSDDIDVFTQTIPRFTASRLITRSYVSNSEKLWNGTIQATVSAIATDEVTGESWCKVSANAAYRVK